MERTHNNGELRTSHISQTVTLIGWVSKKRNFGSLVFIDLRDRYGITQIVCKNDFEELTSTIRNEFILKVVGTVIAREQVNSNLPTGDIEVIAQQITIINTAETPPMIIADETDALEDFRLKYRFLDLRRPVMQQKLITRHNIVKSVRQYLDDLDFIEIETPILTRQTPEGARDYLVPSRVNPGKFYALPQSPQLFKQLLMISGFERYYQIARCFRDEDLRSDRQPDFTQIDIETSFFSEADIFNLIEGLYVKMLKDVKNYNLLAPFRRFSFKEVMNRFGSDKPDTRIGFELTDVSAIFAQSEMPLIRSALDQNGFVKAIKIEGKAKDITRKDIDSWNEVVRKFRTKGLFYIKVNENGILEGPLVKSLTSIEEAALRETFQLAPSDMVIFLADAHWESVCTGLGAIRNLLGKRFAAEKMVGFDILWVVDFPLFEYDYETKQYSSTHHAFTRPLEEDIPFLETDPSKVRAHHYDIVMNGYELGSGSLRIYDQLIQRKVFEIIGLSKEQIEDKFGFFINAFKYGTPPHGGVAFGLDRIAMILTGSESLRDVVAFPKNASAACPMTEAPSSIEPELLNELHIKVINEK